MSGRACPVPGCGAAVRSGHAMCRDCWSMVPATSQRLVHSAWKAVRVDRNMPAEQNYRQALALAVAEVVTRR